MTIDQTDVGLSPENDPNKKDDNDNEEREVIECYGEECRYLKCCITKDFTTMDLCAACKETHVFRKKAVEKGKIWQQ